MCHSVPTCGEVKDDAGASDAFYRAPSSEPMGGGPNPHRAYGSQPGREAMGKSQGHRLRRLVEAGGLVTV